MRDQGLAFPSQKIGCGCAEILCGPGCAQLRRMQSMCAKILYLQVTKIARRGGEKTDAF